MKTNRKKAPWIVVCICCIATICTILISTFAPGFENVDASSDSMFECVERSVDYDIVYHKKTKVMYAISQSHGSYGGSSGVFSVLVDKNGEPLLWSGQ